MRDKQGRIICFENYKHPNKNANSQNKMKICHFHIDSNAIDGFYIRVGTYFVILHYIHSFKTQFCTASILKG